MVALANSETINTADTHNKHTSNQTNLQSTFVDSVCQRFVLGELGNNKTLTQHKQQLSSTRTNTTKTTNAHTDTNPMVLHEIISKPSSLHHQEEPQLRTGNKNHALRLSSTDAWPHMITKGNTPVDALTGPREGSPRIPPTYVGASD